MVGFSMDGVRNVSMMLGSTETAETVNEIEESPIKLSGQWVFLPGVMILAIVVSSSVRR